MFPPPQPWKQISPVDPNREYVAFTSRFFLKSWLRLPSFMAQAQKITKQVSTAPGIVGWSLGSNLPTLEFYTLSAWEDEASLRNFIRAADHAVALTKFQRDMRANSIFVHYTVLGRDLPLKWADAVARQNEQRSSAAAKAADDK